MSRFPARTLILMTLAVLAFAWFWWRMHPAPKPMAPRLQLIVLEDGGVP